MHSMMPSGTDRLVRTLSGVIIVGGLLAGSVFILQPFLNALLWAVLLVVSTWPLLRLLENRARLSRPLAVCILSSLLLALFLIPFGWALSATLRNLHSVMQLINRLDGLALPHAPAWLTHIPVFGDTLLAGWEELASLGTQELTARAAPFAARLGRWLLAELGGLGNVLAQGLLVIALSALLFLRGEWALNLALLAGERIGGDRGRQLVRLAGQAIRGIALGVGLTAVAQTVLGTLGLIFTGVPYAAILGAVMFVACVSQIGPLIVLLPAVAWLYWQGHTGAAIGLLVWSGLIATLDNVMRPMLIRRGADLPLLLIFAGVIGGLLGLGLVGLFVGPVCLAVTWTLLDAWLSDTV
jgi:predicted PurR-regulated permease PerM